MELHTLCRRNKKSSSCKYLQELLLWIRGEPPRSTDGGVTSCIHTKCDAFIVVLDSVSAAKWKRRPSYRPTSIGALRHLRNLPNPRSLEFSYDQSQCKYRNTTVGNLTKRHTLANARPPHHLRATSSNRSSSYRPEFATGTVG